MQAELTIVASVFAVGAFSAVVVAVVAADSAIVAVVTSPFITTFHSRVIPVAPVPSVIKGTASEE